MNVVVDGLMTSYQRTGKGKPLVFLHGWGDTSKTFSELVTALSDKYEIYLLDLPGFGGTQAPPRAWDLGDYSNFLEAWLKKIDIKPYALVGHSYGGSVAIYALSQKSLGQKLVLLASAGIRNKHRAQKDLTSNLAKLGKIPLAFLPENKRRKLRQKFYKSIGSDLMLLPHMEETFKKIINQDVSNQAKKINAPTLLIYGSQDKSTPVSDGKLLNSLIAGSKIEIVNAGHFLHQELPEETSNLIDKFLSGKLTDA
ncbi:alpha/beta hydrolase [Candidatus Saccharibacteria bacterium]|nr:alpha/beta hydrolase [Candidatus Saccharibacteria bacterium]